MKVYIMQAWYLINHRAFLSLLLIINVFGTVYGYYWYKGQLSITEPIFYIFVPDSPTASLFFCFAVLGWLLGKNFKLMEVLALVTLIKYGLWAVVMNLLTVVETGYLSWEGWMLVASHFLMAVQAVLYYNMGETMRFKEEYTAAEEYYLESLKYSELAEDSLAIATAYKGLGSLYMEKHRTSKAMRYLDYANKYFSGHEKEELQFRMESLDYTEQVRALQNRRLTVIVLLMAALLLMVFTTGFALTRLKRTRTEKQELNEILEETVAAISPATEQNEIRLKPKEKEVLDLIAKGFTNTEIADAMCLSPETIKWYKRKLFAVFDVSNSAELIKIATDKKLL